MKKMSARGAAMDQVRNATSMVARFWTQNSVAATDRKMIQIVRINLNIPDAPAARSTRTPEAYINLTWASFDEAPRQAARSQAAKSANARSA
jgi:hypothetical protein